MFRRLDPNTPVKPMPPSVPSVHLAAARPKMIPKASGIVPTRPADVAYAPPPPPPPPPGDEDAAPVSIQDASTDKKNFEAESGTTGERG